MSCKELLEQRNTLSGWYTVYTASKKPINVFCDMHSDGGGWLVFQRRMDGSVDFFRDWNSYKRGFGNKQTEFWLGNENIHLLTATVLRISNESLISHISILHLCSVSEILFPEPLNKASLLSAVGCDSLTYQNNMPFSTEDRDPSAKRCPDRFKGAWWYNDCHLSNLNGIYKNGSHESFADGINWKTGKGYNYSYKYANMKIRLK
ncbi:FCN1 protein, partial [Polyodon spathula]|nr:FCN1 protein [Polyodon spathula]